MKRIVLIGLLLLFFVSLSHAFTLSRCIPAQSADQSAQCNQPFPARQSLSIILHANLAGKSHYIRLTKSDTYSYHSSRSPIWLTRDPLNEQGGLNMTAFCQNDPINAIDPWGLNPSSIGANAAGSPFLHHTMKTAPYSQYAEDVVTVLKYEGLATKDFAVELASLFGDLELGIVFLAMQLPGVDDDAAGNMLLKLDEWGYKGCQLRRMAVGDSYWDGVGNTAKNYTVGIVTTPVTIVENVGQSIEAAKNGDMAAAGYHFGTANATTGLIMSMFAKTPAGGGGYQGVGTFKGAWNNLFATPWNKMLRRGSYKRTAELKAFREELAVRKFCQNEIDAIVAKYLSDYELSSIPKYEHALPIEKYYGASKAGTPETAIGPLAMRGGPMEILWTILHEDFHVRLYGEGFPKGTHCEYTIDVNVGRYFSNKGLIHPEGSRTINNYK